MNGRLARRFGSAAAVVVAVLTVAPPPAAFGQAVIALDSPKANAALTTPSVTISGSVISDAPLLSAPKTVSLSMKDQQQTPVSCTDATCKFSWTVSLPVNGPYDFTVSATDATRLLGIESTAVTQVGHVTVAAPPKKPVLDPPKVTDGRTVELSWARNAEPDMLYYAVFRKDPAGTKFLQVGDKVTQPPASQAKVTFTDTTTTFLGGDFSYQVVAVRKGASGTAATEVPSDPSAALAASVPPPPTTTTAAPAPGTPGAAGGPTTTVKAGQANGVDLSGFLSSRAGPTSLPPITVPDPPDPGFQNTLPFGARPAADDTEPGDAEAVPPSTTHKVTTFVTRGAGRPLVPIAGGLILLLLAMHMRLLNRRIKQVDGDLPLDPPVTAASKAAAAGPPGPAIVVEPLVAAAPVPAPEPPPETHVYDVLEEEADWAPPPVEAAPDPDPDPEPDPALDLDLDPDDAWAPPLDLDLDLEPEPEPEPDIHVPRREIWAPELVDLEPAAALEQDFVYDLEPRALPEEAEEPDVPDEPDEPAPDEIEVFDVVAPTRRRLVRSGSR